MREYIIMADVNADTDPDYIRREDLAILPQYYHFNDGKMYGDEEVLTPAQFYGRLDKERAYSSGCNPERVRGIMEDALKKDLDMIILMASSECSGSYSTVCREAEALLPNYPGARIHVVDSYLECAPIGLLVKHANEMRKAGATFDEVVAEIEEKKKYCDVYFLVDDLKYLVRGGRLNPISGAVGTMLSIKPILHFEEGRIVPLVKCRGRQMGKKTMIRNLKEMKLDKRLFAVVNTMCEEEAREYQAELEKELDLKADYISEVSLIIGTHTGPNAIGVAFCRLPDEE
ncbi:MAG: DegV family protein [Lachnospiraceae bacterium]|nr:DegV family protein [Lachnospiraceae bacterium]